MHRRSSDGCRTCEEPVESGTQRTEPGVEGGKVALRQGKSQSLCERAAEPLERSSAAGWQMLVLWKRRRPQADRVARVNNLENGCTEPG